MSKLDWLKIQLAEWQQHQLVSQDQAAAIVAYYESKPQVSLARIMLSAIGAVMFGLGVILFFAFNWAAMPKLAKLGVIFGGLLCVQLCGIWYGLRRGNRALSEGLLGLGTVMFGAGIFLVSQIYHIDEHYPTAFVVWGLGALAMAWAAGSVTQGFLAVGLLGMWYSAELQSFHQPMHAAAPLIGLGLLPFAWRERAPRLFVVASVAFVVTLLFSAVHDSQRWIVVDGLLLSVAVVLIAPGVTRTAMPQLERTLTKWGYLGYVAVMYFCSFDRVGGVFKKPLEGDTVSWIYFSILAAAALSALALAVKRELGTARHAKQIHYLLVMLSTGFVLAATFAAEEAGAWIWVWANIVLLVHAVLWIVQGSREQRGRMVAAAATLFVFLAVPRFLDLFDSLLVRAFMFTALGAGLFFLGNFYQRSKNVAGAKAVP